MALSRHDSFIIVMTYIDLFHQTKHSAYHSMEFTEREKTAISSLTIKGREGTAEK